MGVLRSNPKRFPTSPSIAERNVAKWPDQGLTAPSKMLFDFIGIIRSGSNSILTPSPLHSPQAPNGELKENIRGSKSPRLISQRGHAFRCENRLSLPSIEAITSPFPTFNADSTDSFNLLFSSTETFNLSITTSIVCFFCLSSLGYPDFSASSFSILLISPSNLILEKPSCFS